MKFFISSFLVLISANTFTQTITQFADSIRIANNIPAMAYAVITSDSIILTEVIGVRKINSPDSAKISDRFHLGSNTKAITGYIAAKLVEEGKLSWDTKLFDMFPEWKSISKKEFLEITLKDLLSHRAMIPAFTSGIEFMQLPSFKGNNTDKRKEFGKWLISHNPAENKNNASFIYSNAGYALATVMLEKVTGISWKDLIIKHLNTDFNIHPEFSWPNVSDPNQPWGHYKNGNKLEPNAPDNPYHLPVIVESAGDINMTITDYSEFIRNNLKGLLGNSDLLKQTTWEFLHYGIPEYAIGWGWEIIDNIHISSHNGSAGTFFCHTIIYKEKDMAFVIMANTAEDDAVKSMIVIRKELERLYMED